MTIPLKMLLLLLSWTVCYQTQPHTFPYPILLPQQTEAGAGWKQHQHLLNPLTTRKKWDRRGYTFSIQPRACLCSARPCPSLKKRPLVSPAGKRLSGWEPIFPQCFGTDHSFPSLFGNVGAFWTGLYMFLLLSKRYSRVQTPPDDRTWRSDNRHQHMPRLNGSSQQWPFRDNTTIWLQNLWGFSKANLTCLWGSDISSANPFLLSPVCFACHYRQGLGPILLPDLARFSAGSAPTGRTNAHFTQQKAAVFSSPLHQFGGCIKQELQN